MDESLLEILACPACHASFEAGPESLTCTGCGLVYPIRNGIPVLLVGEARPGGTK